MENQNLIILTKEKPYAFFLLNNTSYLKDKTPYIELLLNVKGEANINLNGLNYQFNKNDILLVKPYDTYKIDGNFNIISLTIRYSDIIGLTEEKIESYFVNSLDKTHEANYLNLINKIVSFFKESQKGISLYQAYMYLYSIFDELDSNYSLKYAKESSRHKDRISKIISYIDSNFDKNLSLTDLAQEFGLTEQYLSSFFSKELNCTFKTYYNDVKLKHALSLLNENNLTLEEVAIRSGFTSSQTFFRLFKQKYNVTPLQFKIEHKEKDISKFKSDILSDLDNEFNGLDVLHNIKQTSNTISFNYPRKQNKKPYLKMLGLGDAKNILYKNIQDQINELTSLIKYEYGYLLGIFSDSLYVCKRNGNSLEFDFSIVDIILDYLREKKLLPFINLSYMPKDLAKFKNKELFSNAINVSEPKDINEWITLVKAFLTHVIKVYGKQSVSNWIFSIWKAPESGDKLFGFSDKDIFFEFYKQTYKAIKELVPECHVASPEFLPLDNQSLSYINNFFSRTIKENCSPDILSFAYYHDRSLNDDDNLETNKFKNENLSFLTEDENRLQKVIEKLDNILVKNKLTYIPKYLTAFNLTVSHKNYLLDTAYMGPFVLKNTLDNSDKLDAITYWKISDFEDTRNTESSFPGQLGLYSKNNIGKPQLLAYQYLSRLFPYTIYKDKDYIITSDGEDKILILAYNYIHYSKQFSNNELFNMSYTNRYVAFNNLQDLILNINIKDLNYKSAELVHYYSSKKIGSSYDTWIEMGCPDISHASSTTPQVRILKNLATPFYKEAFTEIKDGVLSIKQKLTPFEVRTILIRLKK